MTSSTAQNSDAEQGKGFTSSAEKAAQLRKKLLESRKLLQKPVMGRTIVASVSEEVETSTSGKVPSEKPQETEPLGVFAKGSALDLEDLLAEGRAAAEAEAASREGLTVTRPLNGEKPIDDENKTSIPAIPLASKEEVKVQEKKAIDVSKGLPSPLSKKQDSPEQGEILEDERKEKVKRSNVGMTPARNIASGRKAEPYTKAYSKEAISDKISDTPQQSIRSRSPISQRHKAPGAMRPISPTGGTCESPKAVELTDFFSHYFDDVREWLELTGYHDQNYRRRAIQRYRALQVSEREALKEQENGQHIMRTTTFALPPPTYQSQSVAGVKRTYSPDRGRQSLYSATKLPRTDYNRYHASNTEHYAGQRSSSVDAGATSGSYDHAPSSTHQYRNRTCYFNKESSPLAQSSHYPDHQGAENFASLDSRISARDQATDHLYDFDRRHTDASIHFSRPDYGYPSSYHRDYDESDYSDHYGYQSRGRGRGRGRGYYGRGPYGDANGASRGRGRGRGGPVPGES